MASSLLANDSSWKTTPSHPRAMGKLPFSNPKFSKKRQLHAPLVKPPPPPLLDADEYPLVSQSAASDDASSINRRASVGGSELVTFNVGNYSRNELTHLKRRLVSELERIRQFKLRIESTAQIPVKKKAKLKDSKRIDLMKNCGQILSKLMRHKHGYIFNTPVDVVNLNLTDYHDVIKTPMDLGTIKTKLTKNLYDSPVEFAADVRLTFNNAMRYNPKGHEVYVLAELQLRKFEELYEPIRVKIGDFDDQEKRVCDEIPQIQEVEASSWEKPITSSGLSNHNVNNSNLPPPPPAQLNAVRTPSPVPAKPLKQPKPKAKDPNKREMSLEEKHKLGIGLQNLPQEKMEQVVQIISKRNGHLQQEGDEIELDIEAVDTETLWELDRFVTNYKKMVSKIKRQALINNAAAAMPNTDGHKEEPGNEVVNEVKKPKKGDVGDEDVDIGDEMPVTTFPPVEIEKDNGHASSSSGSSSSSSDDSSSSSDSDSGSSSGSDSEDAHS